MKFQTSSISKSDLLSKMAQIGSKVIKYPIFSLILSSQIKQDLALETDLSINLSQKREKLDSKLHSLSQQINLCLHETTLLKESIKDSVWMFNKEISEVLLRLKKPSKEGQYIAESFLFLLNQKEVTWKAFQVLALRQTSF